MLRLTKILLFLLIVCPAFAQKNSVKGIVLDTSENKKLAYAIVALVDLKDSTLYKSVRTDEAGRFELSKIPPGQYMMTIMYPKMADYLQSITVTETSTIDLKSISMITKAELLQEVIVRAGVPIRMRGDTLEYTADSFAVKAGANVEELLKRLPGIQVQKDGKIYAQGEEVKKMLVDGDEFFGDDPGLASKYLQADAVEKVQVFDKKSERSEFTGMDDGERTKTINLKLKKDRRNGYFGKASAGIGNNNFYNNEVMGALFNGTRKISAYGLATKTGRQDLSYNDLNNYVNRDYETISDGFRDYLMSTDAYENENYWGSGIPEAMSGGGHFSDKWNYDKQKLFLNYQIRRLNVSGWSNGNSYTTMPDGTAFANKNDRSEKQYNFVQKGSGSVTLKVDSFSTLKISMNGRLTDYSNKNQNSSESRNEKGVLVNNSFQSGNNAMRQQVFAANITYRHRFKKMGRTFSISAQTDYNKRMNDSYDSSRNNYYDPASGAYKTSDSLDQLQQTNNLVASYATKAEFTEMIGKSWMLSLEYGYRTMNADNIFNTLQGAKRDQRVDFLSNDYDFSVNSHITGGTLSWKNKVFVVTAGTKIFFTGLNQVNNDEQSKKLRRFTNFAPNLNVSIKLDQKTNFTIRYTGETFQPSIEQLQPLRRSTNRLFVQIGNPDLQPGFRHYLNLHFSRYNWPKDRYFNAGVWASYEDNNITSKDFTDAQNRRTSQYINLDGLPSVNGWASIGWKKFRGIKPSVNLNFGRRGNYTILNNATLKNDNFNIGNGIELHHEWENHLTTTYRANLNYTIGWSDIQGYQTQRAFTHTHSINNTVYFLKKFELNSDCIFNFRPKNSSFNTNFNNVQWNAYIQRKFWKNDQFILRFSVNDLLNSNNGYSRNVYGNTVSENNRLVIQRYWMFSAKWNFSKTIK